MRLIEFGRLVRKCVLERNPRIKRYVRFRGRGVTGIDPALAEAAATVGFDPRGFDVSSMFAIADALSSQERPMYRTIFALTEERRANYGPKENANGGRPPIAASPEQLAEWRKDMERRKYIRKGKELPLELRRLKRPLP